MQDCCGGGSITVHASGEIARKYGSNLGTLKPSRINHLGFPFYRNYGIHGFHGTGAARSVAKICDRMHNDVWSITFDFPRDQFLQFGHIMSSSGTSCPTSANWGRHSEIALADTSFSSSFRDPTEITVKCSGDGQGTVPTGGVLFSFET